MKARSHLSLLLAAPAVLLVVVTLVYPLLIVGSNAVLNTTAPAVLPRTDALIADWQPGQPVSPALRQALVDDLLVAQTNRSLSRLASGLENEQYGFRELITRTGNALRHQSEDGEQLNLISQAPEWQDEKWWRALKRGLALFTSTHLLHVADYYYDSQGMLAAVPRNQAIFVSSLLRTVGISLVVTLFCAVLAYPVSWLLSAGSRRWQAFLLICVLLPFWTSLLVRTSAWIVLLQRNGLANDLLLWLGITQERLQLLYSRPGVIIAMIHILLPFMILPVYAAMNNIPRFQLRAGLSLGASPYTVFRRVFLPQTVPGLRTGTIIVFVMALGFYITPALIGGPSDQMLSGFIALYLNERLDWATASALALTLTSVMALGYLMIHMAGKVLER